MASNYPSSLDAFTTGVLAGVVSGTDHGNKGDAINKIEAELGIDPSGTAATVKARLDSVESGGRTAVIAEAPLNPAWPEFGALFDNSTNDTAAIQATLDKARSGATARERGKVVLPPGTAKVSALTIDHTTPASLVDVVGAGKSVSVLTKLAGSTTPVLRIDGGVSQVEIHSVLRDFSIKGNAKGGHGLEMQDCARFELSGLDIRDCDRAIFCDGSLVFNARRLTLQANNTGFYARASADHPPNVIKIADSDITGNTTLGVDYGAGSHLVLDTVDIESNGTAANTATGGLFVQATVDDVLGVAQVICRNCWFESNKGRSIQAWGGDVLLDGVMILSPESSRSVYADGVRRLAMHDSFAPGTNDTVTVAAASTYAEFIGSFIYTIASSASTTTRINTRDSAGSEFGIRTTNRIAAADGLTTKVVAGVVSDGSFIETPTSGLMAIDTTNSQLYVRVGATWKKVALA